MNCAASPPGAAKFIRRRCPAPAAPPHALADGRIDMSEVDGVFPAGPGWSPSLQVAEYLGIQPKYTDGTAVGGSSFVIHVEHAAAAIEAGLINVALITRKWAMLNPKAMMRDPLTIDDVLSSRWITYPFHLLDCCLVTDAGGAVVVTSAERAKDCPKAPVLGPGAGEAPPPQTLPQRPAPPDPPATISGPLAFEMAGVRRE